MRDVVDGAVRGKAKFRRIVRHDELPEWARDNEYIVTGYRAPGGTVAHRQRQEDSNGSGDTARGTATARSHQGNGLDRRRKDKSIGRSQDSVDEAIVDGAIYEHASFARCWNSVWLYLHNETVNIHTHLWGAVVSIVVLGLHIVGAQGNLPTWLHPLTHHAIFSPVGIEAITAPQHVRQAQSPSSALGDALRSLLSNGATASAPKAGIETTKHALGMIMSSPAHSAVYPWGSALHRPNDWKDIGGFATFLFGAITVFTCSATFHAVSCHSKDIAHSFNKLDYIGIVAMIVGSFLPMLHYGFYCHVHMQLLYSIAITSLGAFATYTVLSRKYATPEYRPIRTSVFVALGLSAIFPVAHILAMYGHDAVSRTMGLDFLIAGGALYIIGAGLYVARIPERLSPGTFDYFGASHQIFHVLILAAAFCHYVCIRRAYTFWHTVEALAAPRASDATAHAAVAAVCGAFEQLRHTKT